MLLVSTLEHIGADNDPLTRVQPLIAEACEGGGTDWVRPYDLRHAYAIRCFTDPAVNMVPSEDHASWMGHGLDVHERIYLRWMPAARQKLALKDRHARLSSGVHGFTPTAISLDIATRR